MSTAYKLDAHCEAILEEYRQQLPLFQQQEKLVTGRIRQRFDDVVLLVASTVSRVKTDESLAG